MSQRTIEILLRAGLDQQKANEAARGLRELSRTSEEATKRFRQLAEQGEKLTRVGTVMAGIGGAIIAPLALAANEYVQRYKGLEATANNFIRAQQRQADASAMLGRVAATALTPALNQVATLTERIARFAEQHPELVQGAIVGGGALVAAGGALAMAGTAMNTIGKAAELLKGIAGTGGGNVLGLLGKAAVGIGAFAAGLKGGELIVQEYGKSVGDARLANFQLADALKTVREIIASVVLLFAKAFEEAKLAVARIGESLAGIFILAKNAVEKFADDLGLGAAKFVKGILDQVDIFAAQLAVAVYAITHPGDNAGLQQFAQDQTVNAARNIAARQGAINDIEARNQSNQSARDTAARVAGNTMAQNDANRVAASQANLKDIADRMTNFVKTGDLGGVFNSIGQGIKGFFDKLTGGGGGGISTGGQAGVSPEAVRAFIDRNKKVADSDRQYAQEQKDARKQFNRDEAKAAKDHQQALADLDRDQARARADIDKKYAQDNVKARQDFAQQEADVDRKNLAERIRRERDHNDRLLDLAAARDVAGFIEEQRAFRKQETDAAQQEADDKAQRQRDFDTKQAEREQQYKQELDDLALQGQQKRDDLERQYEREKQERRTAFNEQMAQLQDKHNREKEEIDRAFAEQLASLQGNVAGLGAIQDAYYASQSAALAAFVETNKAKLQELYAGSVGLPASTGQSLDYLNKLSSDADARNALASKYLGSFAGGLSAAPSDGYAYLHRGEGVVTAAANMNGGGGLHIGSISIGAGNNVTVDDLRQFARDIGTQLVAAKAGL